jgi:hypothetical protein
MKNYFYFVNIDSLGRGKTGVDLGKKLIGAKKFQRQHIPTYNLSFLTDIGQI